MKEITEEKVMGNLLFALMPLLAAQPTTAALPEARLTWVDVVICQGTPEGKDRQVLSRPTIITRDRQPALISIGQYMELNTSWGENLIKSVEFEPFQAGFIVQFTPTWRADGNVAFKSCITMSELIDNVVGRSHAKESRIRFNSVCKPGEVFTIPLYNVNDYQDVLVSKDIAGAEIRKVAKKPYTGRECWVEFVVREVDPKKDKLPTYPPAEPGKGTEIPRAVPAGR